MVDRQARGSRRVSGLAATVAVVLSAVGAIAPEASSAAPVQEEPTEDAGASPSDDAVVAIDVDVADGDAVALTGALDEMQANVGTQLRQLEEAEAAVVDAIGRLSEADGAIIETEARIEELTSASDSVVVTRFMNPPTETAVEALTAASVSDATVKQALLDMRAEEDAAELAAIGGARAELETQKEAQEQVAAEADAARQDAEAALVDLQAAVGQEAQFISDIRTWMADPQARQVTTDPRLEAVRGELAAKLNEIEEAEAARAAAAALAEAQRRAAVGGFQCPLQGEMSFSNTWGAARSGGRSHKGTDMMSPRNTPVVARASGRLVHDSNSLGGLVFKLYTDDGHMYYGAHMQSFENQGAGYVTAGTLIGRVGDSGNAAGAGTHLHFEYHPNGGAAVNPYPRLAEVCQR